jgi:hypothetical protein
MQHPFWKNQTLLPLTSNVAILAAASLIVMLIMDNKKMHNMATSFNGKR